MEIAVTLTAFPAPEFELHLVLRGPGQIDMLSAPDGATHIFEATAVQSAEWVPGTYWWQLRAQSADGVYPVATGQTVIAADLATITDPHDGRSHAEKVLEAIEAVIEGRATKDQESYTIKDRTLQRTPLGELLKFRAQYRDEVRAQKQAARNGNSLFGRMIKVRFTG
ncbi:hypothetical protein JI744_14655 [Tabrizicola sp. KVB23]|uniref:Uncharacterized protein n=1 Tax=Fuscibacter oryzae TaxID=2803939 RepID=A0A8J7SU82_9RHOB|nr:hypothetical protein [Fuscibacter oryzae]